MIPYVYGHCERYTQIILTGVTLQRDLVMYRIILILLLNMPVKIWDQIIM